MSKTYTHPNGYSAVLYGESSLSIYKDGKEVMHTGFRSVNTEAEVMELLKMQPRFREALDGDCEIIGNIFDNPEQIGGGE